MTDGFGADYTFEATGNVNVMRQAVEAARMGWGLCTIAGVAGKGETLDIVPRFLITGRRVAGSSFGGVKGRDQVPQFVERALAGRHRRRVVRLAPHHARRRQPRLRADGSAGRHPERDRVRMIVERVEHPQWLSNAYLVAEGPGGHGFFIDGNGLGERLEQRAADDDITITHVLCTHGHGDHVVGVEELAARHGVPLLAHADTEVRADERLADGDTVSSGGLAVRALYTPGHCDDHLAFLVDGTHCFTADVLFRGTVGGTAGPTGDLAKLKHSILDVLLGLDPETRVFPGHREDTTIADERRSNPFIRAWLDDEGLGEEPCRVSGEEATLLLWAPDYDGGNKALVRLASGEETIVGGSRVERR